MIVIRKREHALRQARYHLLALQGELEGGCDVVHEWGRIGSPGTVRAQSYSDVEVARAAVTTYAAMKRRKGYR